MHSPSHKIATEMFDSNRARVNLAENTTELNSDFVLVIKQQKQQSRTILELYEEGDSENNTNDYAAMIVFNPQFDSGKYFASKIQANIVMVVDFSASMIGTQLQKAKAAVRHFVESLHEFPSK